jgi:hypothetical protein
LWKPALLWIRSFEVDYEGFLRLDQRARYPSVGAIKEDPQAQSFGALHGHKAHLPANMVNVIQPVQLRFVACGVALQLRNSILNRLPEPQTHVEAFLCSALTGHDKTSQLKRLMPKIVYRRPQVFPVVADTIEAFSSSPDYGIPKPCPIW